LRATLRGLLQRHRTGSFEEEEHPECWAGEASPKRTDRQEIWLEGLGRRGASGATAGCPRTSSIGVTGSKAGKVEAAIDASGSGGALRGGDARFDY
jgi:hypothetical protein